MNRFKVVWAVFIAILTLGTASAVATEGDIHERIIAVSDVYIPNNFDSSSDAFVVVAGWFPNSCYKLKEASVQHVRSNLHEITTTAYVTEGMCLTVLLPFHLEVQLGKLGIGEHKFHFINGDGSYLEKSLTIAH